MLQISISTILMTVITTNLFLIVLTVCFCHTDFMVRMGYRQLALFVLFALLRLLLPVELPFTVTVRLPLWVSNIIMFVHSGLFTIGERPVSLWLIFKWIWVIGCAVGILRYFISYHRSRSYITLHGKMLNHKEPYTSMLRRVCEERGRANPFTILEMPGLRTPALFGFFSPCILMPEGFVLSEEELYFVLKHETAHHFRHDLWCKEFIRLLTILYWWNPFCHLLNHQTDVILEMRIDHDVTHTSTSQIMEYADCLLNISERAVSRSLFPSTFTLSLLRFEDSDLYKRTNVLLKSREKFNVAVNTVLTLLISVIYLFSYSIVPEAYCGPELPVDMCPPNFNFKYLSTENSYFIDNEDGTYDLYWDGILCETVDSLEYYSDDIPIYTKDNCPY